MDWEVEVIVVVVVGEKIDDGFWSVLDNGEVEDDIARSGYLLLLALRRSRGTMFILIWTERIRIMRLCLLF